jgi:hypothetical protein
MGNGAEGNLLTGSKAITLSEVYLVWRRISNYCGRATCIFLTTADASNLLMSRMDGTGMRNAISFLSSYVPRCSCSLLMMSSGECRNVRRFLWVW